MIFGLVKRRGVLDCLYVLILATPALCAERVDLIVDAKLEPAAERALADLKQVLQRRQVVVSRSRATTEANATRFVIGVAGQSSQVDHLLKTAAIDLPAQKESLCVSKIVQGSGNKEITLLIAGRDTRGLGYALLEVCQAITLTPADDSWLDAIQTDVQQPHLRHRSVTIHLSNRDLDSSWYFDEGFWRDYFTTLARSRFNNFTLTFADQMNYLNPVYAHLVDLPGFEEVTASDVTAEEKRRNLKMLRRITELSDERALDFTFAVWTQQPVEKFGGQVTAKNIPQGKRFEQYCSQGIAAVLKACPSIDAVQFRMNTESGIAEEEQTAYYQSQFDAIANCGRPVKLELRYKGLRPETTRQAINTKLDLTVSTKFWCEHFGLPYHPTQEDTHYRESRYGYGAMLRKPRDFRVIYRLWTVGSHRLLLWADPDYTARFAESCRLGGGEGFEIFAPLTNKGYENLPGRWPIFADHDYRSYQWEQQRYWFYYLTFGRMGYNPRCHPEVWRRELRHRFGEAAEDMEKAYRTASQVLPLITATRMPSASEWRWWPEMDTGGPLQEYMHTPPSDTAQFYGIRTWKRTPNWWRETWDEFPQGYVEDALAGKITGRMTPPHVSALLNQLTQETLLALDQASKKWLADSKRSQVQRAEFRATRLDLTIHALLAQYHAEKGLAATHLGFYQATQDARRLPTALDHMRKAREAWKQIVELTDGVYHYDLLLGHGKDSKRSRAGHHHGGHWKDRLPQITADVVYLEKLVKKHGSNGSKYRRYPLENTSAEKPTIKHQPPEFAKEGETLTMQAKVNGPRDLRHVRLYYRPLDQTADWKRVAMRNVGGNLFEGSVPGEEISSRFDLMYYLEVIDTKQGTLWPSWQQRQPYFVISVQAGSAELKSRSQ